jgi:hypothetical protein
MATKVVINHDTYMREFADLEVGDTFLNRVSTLWMKMEPVTLCSKGGKEEIVNAICLNSGLQAYFEHNTPVLEVDVEMQVK